MSVENIEELSLARLNELMDEAGYDTVDLLSSTYLELNASNEAQYEVTYDSPVTAGVATTHVFVDIDLQDDTRLTFTPITVGDLNLRRTEEQIAAEAVRGEE
jgi:hypothetical protein